MHREVCLGHLSEAILLASGRFGNQAHAVWIWSLGLSLVPHDISLSLFFFFSFIEL